MGMDINPDNEKFFTIQSQGAFLYWVENEYSAKLRGVLVNNSGRVSSNNLMASAIASRSG